VFKAIDDAVLDLLVFEL